MTFYYFIVRLSFIFPENFTPSHFNILLIIIAGTFFVVGFDEHGFISSLSEDNIQKFSERFWKTEEYDDKEVSKAYWDRFVRSIESME